MRKGPPRRTAPPLAPPALHRLGLGLGRGQHRELVQFGFQGLDQLGAVETKAACDGHDLGRLLRLWCADAAPEDEMGQACWPVLLGLLAVPELHSHRILLTCELRLIGRGRTVVFATDLGTAEALACADRQAGSNKNRSSCMLRMPLPLAALLGLTAVALTIAPSVHATRIVNGTEANGIERNSPREQGTSWQGKTFQGSTYQGGTYQGGNLNGYEHQGIKAQARDHQGQEVQGRQGPPTEQQGPEAGPADLGALTLKTVRLPDGSTLRVEHE
jgi:hypothetical protein